MDSPDPNPDPTVEPPPVKDKKKQDLMVSEQRRNFVLMLLLAVKPAGDRPDLNLQRGVTIKSCAKTYRLTISA